MAFDGNLMPPSVQLRNQRPPDQDPTPAAAVRNLFSFAGLSNALDVARQRLREIGDASQQISRAIGWRSTSANVQLIVSQGKSMGTLYVCNRLKRSGVYQPRLIGLRRMRSAQLLQGGEIIDEVYPTLAYVGAELERMHPDKHANVARQMGVGRFTSEQHVVDSLSLWAEFKYRQGRCNWSDVVSLFAVAGGVAVDCVLQGNPEFLPGVVKGVEQVLKEHVGIWIHCNGGWIALDARFREKQKERATYKQTLLVVPVTIFLIVILGVAIHFLFTKEDILYTRCERRHLPPRLHSGLTYVDGAPN